MSTDLPVARGYVRVSTATQVSHGISLSTQQERIKEHCIYRKLNLVEFYIDAGLSGKDTINRPELLRLLNDSKRGDYIIICELSRLSRSTKDSLTILEDLKTKGVNLVCLSPDIDFSTATGTLIFTVISAISKLERERIADNVKNNLQQLSKNNKLRSRPSFGYKFVGKDKDFEPVPEQQAVIQKIISLFEKDACISRVVDQLNKDGDNKVLNLNCKMARERKFTRYLVTTILVDYKIIEPSESLKNRKAVSEKIKTHKVTQPAVESTSK